MNKYLIEFEKIDYGYLCTRSESFKKLWEEYIGIYYVFEYSPERISLEYIFEKIYDIEIGDALAYHFRKHFIHHFEGQGYSLSCSQLHGLILSFMRGVDFHTWMECNKGDL